MGEKWWIPTGRNDTLGIMQTDAVSAYPKSLINRLYGAHKRTELFGSLIGQGVKIKIIINTTKVSVKEDGKIVHSEMRSAEIWQGDLEILEDNEYLTKISILGEGQAHPICDIPFALGTGWWMWVPQEWQTEESKDDQSGISEGTI